jgi:acyl-CoA thioester hydrolase
MTAPDTADGWYRVRVAVRFRDLDPMGHAHHTLPLVYLEEARASFWRAIRGSAAVDDIEYVMAEVTVRFHARIRYPGDVVVGLCVGHVGTKSFTTDFEVRDDAGVLLSSGRAVQVAYDYGANRTRALHAAERGELERWHRAAAAAGHGQEKKSAIPAETSPMNPPRT